MSEWISVKTELPGIEKHVITYCKMMGGSEWYIDINRRNGNVRTDWWSDRYDEPVRVSHWKHLPDPPKETANE